MAKNADDENARLAKQNHRDTASLTAPIGDGRELFGDATPLASGGVAADGLAALADLDINHDGKIDKINRT
ncbi:MAG: hypothetical protein V4623_02300 [Pseudomonadota bacterium]